MARVRHVEGTQVVQLGEGWRFARTPASAIADPAGLAKASLDWNPTSAPCTAASALRALGRWTFDHRVDFDEDDWWWTCRFAGPESPGRRRTLVFDGLATLAQVWLNGRPILDSDNMYERRRVDVSDALSADNELVICCRSLSAALKARRPRPRWKTRLVPSQQLRWFRATLLGRIPAWSPPAAPVGPWRGVGLESASLLVLKLASLRPRVEGDDGIVESEFHVSSAEVEGPLADRVVLRVGDVAQELACEPLDGGVFARGRVRVPSSSLWWPHTHGPQSRHPVRLEVSIAGRWVRVDLGRIGFRKIVLDDGQDGFGLNVNDLPIFCRGACWTPTDSVALSCVETDVRRTLEAARNAGMNMVRVCGPFVYEDDLFYDLCDELGILVWQDFMFANMDYPSDDPAFVASVEREVRDFLDRTQTASCVAVLCGNSEVEQQAAMMGAPRPAWRSTLFSETLPRLVARSRPDVPYWPSTPSGGALPFLNDEGTAHYFGVGAYLRPLNDARRASVRFATECLAFSNVPSERVVDELASAGGTPPQTPAWKARVPRDGGAGWDFEDVRDHYLRVTFGADVVELRYSDVPRYLALSRVVPAEVMNATFAEWRRAGSSCRGALIWFLRDLWPGAGWGVLDSTGSPKAPYYALRRSLQPVVAHLVDEGLNGYDVHLVNEGAHPFDGQLRTIMLRDGTTTTAEAKIPVLVPARAAVRVNLARTMDHFIDATYAYRFGPAPCDVVAAELVDRATETAWSRSFAFPSGLPSGRESDLGLLAEATPTSEGCWSLVVSTRRFAAYVTLDIPGFACDDDFFHVAPGMPQKVTLRRTGTSAEPRGTALALNARSPAKIQTGKEPTA